MRGQQQGKPPAWPGVPDFLVFGLDPAEALLGRMSMIRGRTLWPGADEMLLGVLAAKLSGGERQLAAVARALIAQPALLFADEPTGSVDSGTGQLILDHLLGWCRAAGATLVLVTHDAAIARAMDRIVVMRDGRIVDPGYNAVLPHEEEDFERIKAVAPLLWRTV